MKINFHTKLFIALGILVCLSTTSILVVLQETTKKRILENIRNRFEGTRVALRHLQSLRTRFAVDAINNLTASNAQFRSVLSTASIIGDDMGFGGPDNEGEILKDANLRLNSILPFLSMYQEADIFVVANAEGALLFTKTFPDRFGDDLTNLHLFEELADEEESVDIWQVHKQKENGFLLPEGEREAVYQVIARPIVFREEIHGVVVCGNRIDKDILMRLKSISGVDLALYSGERLNSSTLPLKMVQGLTTFIKTANFRKVPTIHEIRLENEDYLSMRFPVLPNIKLEECGLMVLKSLTEELKFVSRLRTTLFVVGGIILIIAIGFSFILSRGITKPVKKLALAARDIGMGKLDIKTDIRTGDEFEQLGDAFNGMVKGLKERDFIKSTFERYVSRTVASEIIKNPNMIQLGGQKKTLTIFFTDIGNFTNLSESLAPEKVVKHLNMYFQGMCNTILEYHGTVNKFQGDSILAFWGAPISQEDHALLACRAAIKCREFFNPFRGRMGRGRASSQDLSFWLKYRKSNSWKYRLLFTF